MSSHPSEPTSQSSAPFSPNWLLALVSCLIVWPLGLAVTVVPVFLQDRANTAIFTTLVLQTALFAGVSFPLVARTYR
jgi:hypothetical protein